jgi:tetratricopeptide (TPR) repeat protein
MRLFPTPAGGDGFRKVLEKSGKLTYSCGNERILAIQGKNPCRGIIRIGFCGTCAGWQIAIDLVVRLRKDMLMNFLFGETGDSHAKKGVMYANQGDFRQAILEIESALEKGTKSYKKHELLAILGRAYQQIGENEEAISACKQAISIFPDYPAAWNNMGIALRGMGNMADAEACYLRAVQIDPEYAHAHASLGALYIHLGQAEKAKVTLEQAIQINPGLNIAHGNLALAYAMLGKFNQANASLKQAIALGYSSWQELAERIQALATSPQLYSSSEPNPKLEPVPDFPFTRYPSSSQSVALTREADRLLAIGQRRDAINIYKRALSIEPNCSYVIIQYGLALQEEGRVADAIQCYSLALKIDPEFGHVYYARGWAKHFLKDYQGELDDGQHGLELDPENPGPYLRRIGAAHAGMGKYRDALEVYSRAIDLNPKDEGTIYNMGLCYLEMGEYRNAIDEFTRALQLDPDWDWALLSRAQAYLKLGERQRVLEDVNEVLRLHPNHQRALQLRTDLQ